MEPQTPLVSQPITPNPEQLQSAPQPVQQPTARPPQRKTLWFILGGVMLLLAVPISLYFWQAQAAPSNYRAAVTAYKQAIKAERDALNEELDGKDISGKQGKAKPIFEDHGKKLEAIIAQTPQLPKAFGIIPLTVDTQDMQERERLSTAASNYAKTLRYDYAVYNFYIVATEKFKPIKELGTIIALDGDKLKKLGNELWPAYTEVFRNLKPPAGLETMHTDVIKQLEEIGAIFKRLANEYDSLTLEQVDKTIIALRPQTDKVNSSIVTAINDASNKAYDDINAKYDELDALLK